MNVYIIKLYDETLKCGDEQQSNILTSNIKHTVGVQLVNQRNRLFQSIFTSGYLALGKGFVALAFS
jgi:hypothetical protein